MSRRGVQLHVSLAGEVGDVPNLVVLRVDDRPLGLTGEQASALAAALTEAACRLDDVINEQCAAWTWRANEKEARSN